MGKEGQIAHRHTEHTLAPVVETKEKYATISGFFGDIVSVRLLENKKSGEDDLFVKFTLGQELEQGGPITWLVVAMRGRAAERLCELVAKTAGERGRHYLTVRGAHQERHDPRSGRVRQEFWAFAVKPLPGSG